jgi:hypothetical protein
VNHRTARALAILVAIWTASGEAALAQQGGSLEFDGTDDKVTVPYNASFPTEVFSIAAWIKTTEPGHRSAIIARGEDDNSWDLAWHLYLEPDGSLRLMVEDTSMDNHCYPYVCFSANLQSTCTLSGTLQVADDTWHHVAATRTAGGDLVMYVDGQAVADCTQTGVPSADNFQDLTIGCTHGFIGPPPGEEPPIWFFPGQIDEPAMWNLAMSALQMQDVYATGVDPQSAGLVGFWAFEDAPGQIVSDLSPAGNDGHLGDLPVVDDADPIWIAGKVTCLADFDGDDEVGINDFLTLLAAWGPCVDCPEDLDDDDDVGINDFLSLLAAWGPCS